MDEVKEFVNEFVKDTQMLPSGEFDAKYKDMFGREVIGILEKHGATVMAGAVQAVIAEEEANAEKEKALEAEKTKRDEQSQSKKRQSPKSQSKPGSSPPAQEEESKG